MSFKKIVSDIAFSPSAIGQLIAYSKKTKRDELTRKIGLLFLILAILVQSITILRPPESSNAASVADMIDRGYGTDPSTCSNSKQPQCIKGLTLSTTATNLSQGNTPAANVIQQPGDQISSTIIIENTTTDIINTKPKLRLADTLEYAELIDEGDGVLDDTSNTLLWANITIPPKTSATKTYILKILDEIPGTAQATFYPESYDCKSSYVFGNKIDMNINCPIIKNIESTAKQLPELAPIKAISLSLIVLIIAVLLYVKTRQINREIKQIRHESNAGTI